MQNQKSFIEINKKLREKKTKCISTIFMCQRRAFAIKQFQNERDGILYSGASCKTYERRSPHDEFIAT